MFYYGLGYIIYSILISSLYYFYFWKKKNEDRQRVFLIRSFDDLLIKCTSPFLDEQLLDQTWKSLKRGIAIRILNEGEKYLLTMFPLISYEEQAIYYLIYLFGSTLPQLIFSTIEQISFNYFQQTFSMINNLNQPLTFNGISLRQSLSNSFLFFSRRTNFNFKCSNIIREIPSSIVDHLVSLADFDHSSFLNHDEDLSW